MTRTPATAAAHGFLLSLVGVVVFLMLESWFGTFAASLLIVASASAGAWFEAQRCS
jgi:UPF0716 family protein affecting phage T7 exclusion